MSLRDLSHARSDVRRLDERIESDRVISAERLADAATRGEFFREFARLGRELTHASVETPRLYDELAKLEQRVADLEAAR